MQKRDTAISVSERAPVGKKADVDKIKKYGWQSVGNPGELRMLDKNDILIDPDYQRDISISKVRSIASEWNWIACGAIVVSYRDGAYYGIDGQHRIMGARSRSDIKELPCVVYRLNRQQEACAFLELNGGRPVSTLYKYRASLVAGDETALFVKQVLDGLGIVASGECKPGEIRCLALVLRLASLSRSDFVKVITFASELCTDKMGINERLLGGLDYLHKNCGTGLDDKRLTSRLMEVGPGRLIEGAVRASSYFARGGAKIFATGFLDVINKGLRSRFEFNAEEEE